VRSAEVQENEAQLRLDASVSGLAEKSPTVSARSLLSRAQRRVLLVLGILLIFAFVVEPIHMLTAFVAVITVVYVVMVTFRFSLFVRSTKTDVVVVVTDEEARAVADELLPVYTVLIPAFHEPEVINHLIEHVARIEYPPDRLDIKVLIEADDNETIDAIGDADPGQHFELVFVPPSDPRTKPKALNYGLSLAKGDLVAVYDAEDIPDPLQLRRAAIAMGRLDSTTGCLQSKLSYHNPTQNLITRWFTIEYAMWFSFFLPGLASIGAPIPLGGTSNHFRRSVLRKMGAWDPYNVTEDADLGIRMFREGYRVGILDSTTEEEANSDFVNWIKQRSRWYKGYLQTFLVHMRQPRVFVKEAGWKGVVEFSLFVGGTPILTLLNPIFWLLTILWFVAQPHFIQEIFPAPVYYAGLICWAFGNFLLLYLTVISCRIIRHTELLWAALLVPLYWVMMSIAAVKAVWQLAWTPTHWEKTVHGLSPTGLPNPAEQAFT
jgi:cellulose synthase/poly-beta-1,6-N-acetylglucosamine synthase-like glycosyltransferase